VQHDVRCAIASDCIHGIVLMIGYGTFYDVFSIFVSSLKVRMKKHHHHNHHHDDAS